jgi:uncharacterized protein (DUF58 family)
MNRRPLAGEWQVVLAGLGLAVIGWWAGSTLLAMAGAVIAVTAALLSVWQQHCLSGVRYTRVLGQDRANFGEEVSLEVQIVNDKLLPLTWLHIDDQVPAGLPIRGATVTAAYPGKVERLHIILPMLPYHRVRRRLTIVCDRRGLHRFGPADVSSGNPVGYRVETRTIARQQRLLVYPKVFRLHPTGVASRVPLGDHRSSMRLLGDPSRVMGVRPYQAGDPLRHVDWRATARSDSLLVRIFEPTTALRVAVFADLWVPQLRLGRQEPAEVEFAVAVTASIVSDLAERKVAVGLYSSATVDQQEIAHVPTRSPSGLTEMLESLARASVYGSARFATALLAQARRLQQGTSLVVIAPHFPESTLLALSELRRRFAITAIWIATEHGAPPPSDLVDTRWEVGYCDDWKERSTIELAS